MLLATFMGLLDVSIVAVAVPSVQSGLGASFGEAQFVAAGYTLTYAVGLVTGGRLGDLHGRRRTFLVGVTLFILTSMACAVAPSAPVLIGARMLQGLAAAVMLPQVLSVIQSSFTGAVRAAALGCYGTTIGLASITGQIVGGALLAWNPMGLGWRSTFLVNVPIGLLAAVVGAVTVPESRGVRARLDLGGAGLLGLALTGLLLPPVLEWPAWGWPVLAAGAGLLVVFARYERRQASPLVPMRLLAQWPVRHGLFTVLAFYTGNAGFFLLLAYHLQAGLGLSPLGSGLAFAPLGTGFALTSLAAKRRTTLVPGTVLMAVSLAAVLGIVLAAPEGAQAHWLPAALAVSGLGEGLVAAPLIGTVLAGVGQDDTGAASGILLTATQIANAAGVALIGGVFAGTLGATPGTSGTSFSAYTHATAIATGAVLVLAVLTGILARALGSTR
ncbi:MFS transporter [Streptomyces luteireticuli]|uniref:MFS transporter n=1 Tax=Streptomyces luteireticuli TaxID=173858 RepID=A0ABN0YMK2_9ACTN